MKGEDVGSVVSHRSHRWRPLVFVSSGVVALLIVLAGTGAIYQAIAGYRDRQAFPAPGKLVDVGGFRMHLYCIGQGSPTVILDSGLSNTWIFWHKVQPDLAHGTCVCAYDRAGLGWSDPSPRPSTSKVIAEDLHTLLRQAGIGPPFVLVGHSMGGFNVRMYASLYQEEVAGMVLVDSCHPEQLDRLPPESEEEGEQWRRVRQREALLMPLGLPRLLGSCGTTLLEVERAFRSFDCTVQQKRGWLAESDAFAESASQVRDIGSLGDMPLVVVTQDPQKPDPQTRAFLDTWRALQEDLAGLSSRGSQVIAKGSGHMIHLDRPDIVIGAVQQVIADVRSRTH